VRAESRPPLADLAARIDELSGRVAALEHAQGIAGPEVSQLKDLAAIQALGRWIRHVELDSDTLVSVILPTCDRPLHLTRAVRSVLAQRYEHFELLVVQDGESPDTDAAIAAADDPRIRHLRIAKAGVCAARNAALSAASGEIIAYLDDDNVMDPDWLYAVVWAFEQRPATDVLYGAFAIDDVLRLSGAESGALPRIFLHTWSREALRRDNLADMGAIAHRAGLPGAWFDEGLREMGDWDLLLRLTADSEPLVLPAVACYYTTDAPARLTGGPTNAADRATVLARAAGGPWPVQGSRR
jgi:Glycosyl transferase family 2